MFFRVIGVAVVIFLSGLSLQSFQIHVGDNFTRDSDFQLLLPGFLFSLFIVVNQLPYLNFAMSFLLFVMLGAGYYFALFLGLSTLGFGSPVSGALGAFVVGSIANYNFKKYQIQIKYYILAGFFSSLIGWGSTLALSIQEDCIWVSAIILLWPLIYEHPVQA